jgi:hypothetical protein
MSRTKKSLQKKFSKKTSKTTTGQCLKYEEISLKLYFEIAKSGDLKRLIKSGNPSLKECRQAWAEIVENNSKSNGQVSQVEIYKDLLEGYNSTLAELVRVRANICILYFETDDERINWLREKGYNLDTSSKSKFIESINSAMNKTNNLITRLHMRENQIKDVVSGFGSEPATLEDLIAKSNTHLGFTGCDMNMTLAQFNAYQRVIALKNRPKPKSDATGTE